MDKPSEWKGKIKFLESDSIHELEKNVNAFLCLDEVNMIFPVQLHAFTVHGESGAPRSRYLATVHYVKAEEPAKPSTGLTKILRRPPAKKISEDDLPI